MDGARLVPVDGKVLAARRRMMGNGMVLASLAIDTGGRLRGQPRVSAPGLYAPDDPETAQLASDFADELADLPAPLRRGDDDALADAARAALRRALGRRLQKRPLVDVHLLRV